MNKNDFVDGWGNDNSVATPDDFVDGWTSEAPVAAQEPEEKSWGSDFVESAMGAPKTLGTAAKGIYGAAVYGLPETIAQGAEQLFDENPRSKDDWKDWLIRRKENYYANQPEMEGGDQLAMPPVPFIMPEGMSQEQLAEGLQSLPYSGVALGGSLAGRVVGGLAGAGVGAAVTPEVAGTGAIPGLVAGQTAGAIAGSAAVITPIARNQIERQLIAEYERLKGEPATELEVGALLADNDRALDIHTAGEVLPEAIGNAFEIGFLAKMIGKLPAGEKILKKLGSKSVEAMKSLGLELGTETVTGMIQQPQEVKMGMRPGEEKRSLTSGEDWVTTLHEVAPAVFALQGVTSGGATTIGMLRGAKKDLNTSADKVLNETELISSPDAAAGVDIIGSFGFVNQPVEEIVDSIANTPVQDIADRIDDEMLQTEHFQTIVAELAETGVNIEDKEAVKRAIVERVVPVMSDSLQIGVATAQMTTVQKRKLFNDLNNIEDPGSRIKAVELIEKGIENPSVAKTWANAAMDKVEAGEQISVNQDFVEFASQDEETVNNLREASVAVANNDYEADLKRKLENLKTYKNPTDKIKANIVKIEHQLGQIADAKQQSKEAIAQRKAEYEDKLARVSPDYTQSYVDEFISDTAEEAQVIQDKEDTKKRKADFEKLQEESKPKPAEPVAEEVKKEPEEIKSPEEEDAEFEAFDRKAKSKSYSVPETEDTNTGTQVKPVEKPKESGVLYTKKVRTADGVYRNKPIDASIARNDALVQKEKYETLRDCLSI